MLNIGGQEDDASYRYKMPPLRTKIEGRGNGIKTVIPNMVEVADALKTMPLYPTRFLGIELGAQSRFDKTRKVGIVNGAFQAADLQVTLKKFINMFILCPKCRLPELEMKVHKQKQKVFVKCASCGHKGELKTGHRLNTVIVKFPPKGKRKANVTKQKQQEQSAQAVGGMGAGLEQKEVDAGLGGEDDDTWSVSISEEEVAKRKQREMATLGRMRQSKRRRQQHDAEHEEEHGGGKGKDAKKTGPALVLRQFLEHADRDVEQILDEVKRLELARGLQRTAGMKMVFEAILGHCADDYQKVLEVLTNYKQLLPHFLKTPEDEKIFFGCLEEVIAVRNPGALLSKTAHILEVLYDKDIATEEQILAWYDLQADKAWVVSKEDAARVRVKAKVFVDWLRAADSDGDEEDDDDDDEDEE